MTSNVLLVGDEDRSQFSFLIEPLEDGHNFAAGDCIQRAGGLIGENYSRVSDDRSGDCYTLLLAAGKLGWFVVLPVEEADTLQCFYTALPAIRRAGVNQRSSTCSIAVILGSRLKFWKTKPIFFPRTPASWLSDSVATS